MNKTRRSSGRMIALLLAGLVGAIVWNLSLSRQPVHAQGYDRTKYYTRAPRGPFTFVSRYTLTTQSMDHAIRIEMIEAQDGAGRWFTSRQNFLAAGDTEPAVESQRVVASESGKATLLYWSKWQNALRMPMLVSYAEEKRLSPEHTIPGNNCNSPEPSAAFLRREVVSIGGQKYETSVIQYRDRHNENENMTAWYATSPPLGCLELKSISNFISPEQEKGTTVHEPLSITLGEPDSSLMDIDSKIRDKAVETVAFSQWEATIKSKTNAYKAQLNSK